MNQARENAAIPIDVRFSPVERILKKEENGDNALDCLMGTVGTVRVMAALGRGLSVQVHVGGWALR